MAKEAITAKDIAVGERIKKEELSKPVKDFLEETQKEDEITEISRKQSKKFKEERKDVDRS